MNDCGRWFNMARLLRSSKRLSKRAAKNVALIVDGLREMNATMRRILFYMDRHHEITQDILLGLQTCNAILEASNAHARELKEPPISHAT